MTPKFRTNLRGASRLNSSVNGNPRFTLHTDDGDFVTKSDSSISYEIENLTSRISRGGFMDVEMETTRAGRVWNVSPWVGDSD